MPVLGRFAASGCDCVFAEVFSGALRSAGELCFRLIIGDSSDKRAEVFERPRRRSDRDRWRFGAMTVSLRNFTLTRRTNELITFHV